MCMFGSPPLFLWLGVEVILYTITKCIWDLSPSSRGGNGLCPHALTFSASVDYKTYKQQQVAKGFSLFSYLSAVGCKAGKHLSPEELSEQKDSPKGGSFPSFWWYRCESLCLGHTVASLGEGITCFPLGKGKGYFLSPVFGLSPSE